MSGLKRRVYLYKPQACWFDVVRGKTQEKKSKIDDALSYIRTLPLDKNASPNAYLRENGTASCSVQIFQDGSDHVAGRIGRTRYDAWPQIEVNGQFRYIEAPEKGAGIYEASHFVYIKQEELLLMEMNIHAPRHNALGGYLINKVKDHKTILLDQCSFTPIIRGDALDEFMKLRGEVAKIELSVHSNMVEKIVNAGKLGEAFDAIRQVDSAAQVITLSLSGKRYGKRGRMNTLKNGVSSVMRMMPDAFVSAKGKIERTPNSQGELVAFDLLADKLIFTLAVPTTKDRVIQSRDMFNKMLDAYNEMN